MISIMTKTSVEQLVNVGAQIELFQKISNTGGKGGEGFEDILFWNLPGIFHLFTLHLEIPDKKSSTPEYSTKLC